MCYVFDGFSEDRIELSCDDAYFQCVAGKIRYVVSD